jgi:phage host-nuclease inhibitor protein Gam
MKNQPIDALRDAAGITEPSRTADAFHIQDEAGANWYLRKLANLDAEKKRIKAQADAALKRIESEENALRFRFDAQLQAWAKSEIETRYKGRKKSLILLQGTIGYKTRPEQVRISDEGAASEYAARLGRYQRVVLDTQAYRQTAAEALSDRGELLPGVELVPAEETFSIRFPKVGEETATE